MRGLFIIALSVLVLGAHCKKDQECHTRIEFTNNSGNPVRCAIKFQDVYGKCRLSGDEIATGASRFFDESHCWDNSLNAKNFEIYIVDPTNYNESLVYYDCDSVEIKNTVLKKYDLTLDDLKAIDFKIVYQ